MSRWRLALAVAMVWSACPAAPPVLPPAVPAQSLWSPAAGGEGEGGGTPANLLAAGSLECTDDATRTANSGSYGSRCVDAAGRLHGAFIQLDAHGRYRVVGHYRRGLRHGLWTLFLPSGMLSAQQQYDSDQLTGVEKIWYADGQLRLRREYLAGKPHGKTTYYSPTGLLMGEAVFDQGRFVSPAPEGGETPAATQTESP